MIVKMMAYLEKGNRSAANRNRTSNSLITSVDALPLSYRRIVITSDKIKLGSRDKHPVYY